MFLLVMLSVNIIAQKLLNEFQQNFVEWGHVSDPLKCGSHSARPS